VDVLTKAKADAEAALARAKSNPPSRDTSHGWVFTPEPSLQKTPRGDPTGVLINRPYFFRLAASTLSRSACAARSISLLSLWLWTPRPAETAW